MTIRALARATALPKPTTADESSRSVELLIATSADAGDGVSLTISTDAIDIPGVVPIQLDHTNTVDRMAGRLESIEVRGGKLYGVAVFADAPAADVGWQLARSGCACSIHAEIIDIDRGFGDAPDRATRWRIRHVALVPMGMDVAAVTRGVTFYPFPVDLTPTVPTASATMTASKTPVTAAAGEAIEPTDDAPETISRAELSRRSKIQGAVLRAGLDADVAEGLIERGLPFDAAVSEIFRSLQGKLSQSKAGHPCSTGFAVEQRGIAQGSIVQRALDARFGLKDSNPADRQIPMIDVLRSCLQGSDRSLPYAQMVTRAFQTTDFALALTSTAERTVLTAYQEAEMGIRALAMRKTLTDFKPVKIMRVSQIGAIAFVPEGGEYKMMNEFSEEDAATLTAAQSGGIAKVTRVALQNDSLDIFAQMLAEMSRAAARKEASELAARLADITWDSSNSLTGQTTLNIASVSAAVLKLRRQSDIEGHKISFTPRLLLVAPEQEAAGRQLVGQWTPNTADEVMPFPGLSLEVDHNLAGGTFYIADTVYSPLALGVISEGPMMTQEEEFSTGSRSFKIAHDFGTCAVDGRSIVKVTL